MVTQKDMAIGVLRRRRARLRRMVRAHFVLDHDLMHMHRAVRVYLQVGALIRRSMSRAGRVGGVTSNVNVFSAQESLSLFAVCPPMWAGWPQLSTWTRIFRCGGTGLTLQNALRLCCGALPPLHVGPTWR